jgi:hypothetical protein
MHCRCFLREPKKVSGCENQYFRHRFILQQNNPAVNNFEFISPAPFPHINRHGKYSVQGTIMKEVTASRFLLLSLMLYLPGNRSGKATIIACSCDCSV